MPDGSASRRAGDSITDLGYEIPGPHTVRLEVVDASGATSATTLVFAPQ
jgi:hypothetical protein